MKDTGNVVERTVVKRRSKESRPNLLLAALSTKDYELLLPHLEPVDLPMRKTLHASDAVITHVYFLNTGLASTVAETHDGTNVEVGITGRDGLVGNAVLLGVDRTPNHVFMQSPGEGFRIRVSELMKIVNENESIRALLNIWIYVYLLQVSQTAVCNRAHDVRERLSRWLLMTQDRVQSDVLALTHEFLALMLGVRRSSVTVAAGILQQAGLIDYKHGAIRILDRAGLENAACDCYNIVRDEHARLLPAFNPEKERHNPRRDGHEQRGRSK